MQHKQKTSSNVGFRGRDVAGRGDARRKPASNSFYPGGTNLSTHDGRRAVCAGTLLPDGTFLKRLRAEHVLRTPRAICVQADILQQLQASGCHTIRAEFVDSEKILVAPLSAFMRHGIKVDRGFGTQVALVLSKWADLSAGQQELNFGGRP